jgi:hypothetical protein
MVYPPTIVDEPVVKDTNIDQTILDELFGIEQIKRYQDVLDQTSDEINKHRYDENASYGNLEEEDNDQNPKVEDIDLAELPDLSQYEAMIDWDDLPDEGHLTDKEKQKHNSTQDLNINKV